MIDPATTRSQVQRVGALLQRYPMVYRAASTAIRQVGKARQKAQINRYLDTHEVRCMRVGSGSQVDDGWMSLDILPVSPAVVYMDATSCWPLPTGSIDYVIVEHMIEHVSLYQGIFMLTECRRVMRQNGVLRISTPDFDMFRRLPDQMDDPAVADYVRWSNTHFGVGWEKTDELNADHVIQRMLHQWGHTYLYSESTLTKVLRHAGFRHIVRVRPGESEHEPLRDMDRHAEEIGDAANEIETMAFEATGAAGVLA